MTTTYARLSNRRLAPFLVGTALGNAGDIFTQIAVFWTGLSITGTALSVGSLGAVWTLSAALAGLVSGPIVDRFNRRNMLVILHALLAVLCFLVFALSRAGSLQLWHLWLFLTGEAILGTPVSAAFSAILPDIVPTDRLLRVNGLLSSWGMADNLVEAAVSGSILAFWGPGPIFLFNGIMYLVGSAAALFVPHQAGTPHLERPKQRWRPLDDIRSSLRYIARERLLRRVLALSFLGSLVFAPVFFMAPIVADALNRGPQFYSWFQALTLSGMLVGSLLASSFGAKWPKVVMWFGGSILLSIGFLALGLRLGPVMALIVFFIYGLGSSGSHVYGQTLIQQILPSKIRGRVTGIRSFLGGALQPATVAAAMLLVDRFRVDRVLVGLSILMLLVMVGYLVMLPLREEEWVLPDVIDG